MARGLVLTNGRIHTMDPRRPRAEALAAVGDTIVSVGTASEVAAAARAWGRVRFETVDLAGGCAMPGLVDSHVHFAAWALGQERLDLDGVAPKEAALERVRAFAAQLPSGAWVLGRGWNKNLWAGGAFPTRHDLDAVAGGRPVALASKDGHSLWCSSRALELAGVGRDTPDPPGGEIVREPGGPTGPASGGCPRSGSSGGEPTGILKEDAMALVTAVLPSPSAEELEQAVRRGIARAHAMGLTGVHDMEGADALRAFAALRERGELTLRVVMQVPDAHLDHAVGLGLRSGFGDEWLSLGAMKIFADGALGVQTAAMLEPYEGQPGNYGIATKTPEALAAAFGRAIAGGFSVACHAIGDRANRMVLDALAAHAAASRARGLRHRIEHAQCVHPDDLPRFAALGVVASMQPIHATSDRDNADRYWGARGRYAYAFRDLLASGAVLAFGSDAPVEPMEPLLGIYAAVTRQRADEPDVPPWYPEQCLTAGEAVRAYTAGAAYAAGRETRLGMLAPGMACDVTVVSEDLFGPDPAAILAARAVLVISGGRVVHQAFA